MTKTPGQVAYEAFYEVDQTTWPKEVSYLWDGVAAAVIAAARPQIEAEARAAMVEQCINTIRGECCIDELMDPTDAAYNSALDDAVDAIRALAALPPTHVCVPVEDAKHIERYKWLRNKETFAASIDKALMDVSPWEGKHYRSVEGLDEAIDEQIAEYARIMLAASKVDQCPKTTP